MNINKNVSGNCKQKCEYIFDYPLTNLVAQNKGDHISFKPDNQRVSPVWFNGDKYDVKTLKLYRSSVHAFSGSRADAELMIEHVGVTSGGRLMVCVPIVATNTTTSSLDKLIQRVSQFAPTAGGDAGDISLPNFSIADLVPMKPYYSYKGSLPNSEMGDYKYDVIVFNKDSAIHFSKDGRKMLKNLIDQHDYSTLPGKNGTETFSGSKHTIAEETSVFFNKSGPKKNASGKDEIYIDCQPTGASDDVVMVDVPNDNIDIGSDEMMNKIISTIARFAYFIIAMLIVYFGYKIGTGFQDTSNLQETAIRTHGF
jgi:carbonic anhydrase